MKKCLLVISITVLAALSYSQDVVPVSPTTFLLEDSTVFISGLIPTTKENLKISLKWNLKYRTGSDFFSVERSSNGKDFDVVAILKLTSKSSYEWTDDAPVKGKNWYRVRYNSSDGKMVYSNVTSVVLAGDFSFRFYPNPVDNVLIVRSEVPLEIQITDATGKIRINESRIQGLHMINVTSLEKGIYLLRINNKATSALIQEKLLKN